jgi:hypothetical protein
MAFQWPNLYIRPSATLSNSDHFNQITTTMAMAFKMVIFSSKHFFLLIFFPKKVCFNFDLILIWYCWVYMAMTGHDRNVGDRGVQELFHGDEVEEGA